MLLEFFKAIFIAGVPVALFSYYLASIMTNKIGLKERNLKGSRQNLKTKGIEEQAEESFIQKIVRKKTIKFGGGFYGVLSLMTYLHIELFQLIDFLKNFTSLNVFFDSIGLKMILYFFIDAILNLVTAIIWPVYWLKQLPVNIIWIWLIVAFLSHLFATRYALSRLPNPKEQ